MIHCNTSKEHLTSSKVGQIMSGFPMPKGDLSLVIPDNIDDTNSASHFSSKKTKG